MKKDETWWLNVSYVACFLLAWFLGFKVFQTLGIQIGWAEKYVEWYSYLSVFGGMLLGGLVSKLYLSKPGRKDHHLNVIKELEKVTWPSSDDTKRMTLVVVVVVAIFSAILALFDLGWSWVLRQIIT